MFKVEQYSSIFSIYIYLLLILPVVVFALFEKKSKVLNICISVVVIILLLGPLSLQMWEFVVYLMYELVIICFFLLFRRNCRSELVYYIVFALSLIPIIIIKYYGKSDYSTYLGFTGVSYISFKIWEILFEIHDGHVKKLNLLDVIGFVTFAPTFSSGPIDRYPSYILEMDKKLERRVYIYEYLVPGIKKILIGMLYKFTIAFFISTYVMNRYEGFSIKSAVAYMYSYTLYLFFDFAGYSMMATGTSYLMGVKLIDNFNKPFLSRNMKEFWERWHISLSRWFGDFVYSRFVLNNVRNGLFKEQKTAARWASVFTMLVMGIWHGLYIHYILYGLYHGVLLVLTDVWIKSKIFRRVKKMKYYDYGSRFFCFHLIAFGMLIFSGFWIGV